MTPSTEIIAVRERPSARLRLRQRLGRVPRPLGGARRWLWRRPRWLRWTLLTLVCLLLPPLLFAGSGWAALTAQNHGTPAASARGSGHDAEWLGHAWIDGRRTQADADRLVASLRRTGIRDLFVHAGPFADDGTLDPGLRPRANWFVDLVHAALPGVRVQAWLGARPVPGQLDLGSQATRDNLLAAAGQILDDGFDGIHYDFEPVVDGNADLITVLRQTHTLTAGRRAILSVAASRVAPVSGMSRAVRLLPAGPWALWSPGYLHQVAVQVDQVAMMFYDTRALTSGMYSGYVRRATALTLKAVPAEVAVLIGLPAYHDDTLSHRPGVETTAAAVRGVRLAMGPATRGREFGVAVYVDFAATDVDWAAYQRDWLGGGM